MISIRRHMERLGHEDQFRAAVQAAFESLLAATKENILVTDSEEHTWFCASLDNLQAKLREESSPTNIEVVSALLNKTLTDHWSMLARHVHSREQELKRIISLLTESASKLDAENRLFYVELRNVVQNFQNISQLEDITFVRRKLTEQVTQLQETVARQETSSQGAISALQSELEQAHQQIAALSQAVAQDSLTRLPTRRTAEARIREMAEAEQPFSVAMIVVDRMELIHLRYGPEPADDVLRRFAHRLRESVPERCLVCRWSGPSFVALYDHQPAGEVRASLQRVLGEIAAEPIELTTKGLGLIRITSRYAVHQPAPGEPVEKVLRLIDVFCLSQRAGSVSGLSEEAAAAPSGSAPPK